MTNYGALAILAELPEAAPPRQVRLLIVLETFPPGADGWRTAGNDVLRRRAKLGRTAFYQARRELVAAKLIEHEPGTKRGRYSRWRITFPLAGDSPPKSPRTRTARIPPKGVGAGPGRVSPPKSAYADSSALLTSGNAGGEPESGMSAALEASALSPPSPPTREAGLRADLARLGADDDETDEILNHFKAKPGITEPIRYLRAGLRRGAGPALIEEAARRLAARDAAAEPAPAPPARPPWCGDPECDPRTRLREVGDALMQRCPKCHPDPERRWS